MSPSQLEGAEHPDEEPKDTVARLAKLTLLEYEQIREAEAKKINFRKDILDKEVRQARRETDETPPLVAEDLPWEEPVDGNTLLLELRDILTRHAILPEGTATGLPLWILGTYCIDAFRIWPKLTITSPEKRCGKTTLLETLSGLCRKAMTTSNITPASLFRVIEKYHPTLLIDEADTFLAGNNELRGIINSGHTKSGAFVVRLTGDDHEPTRFSTWTPMAIALIKDPPDTILDRSVVVRLRRKLVKQGVTRLGPSFEEDCQELRQKCQRWANDNFETLWKKNPTLPKSGNDRALDNWSPLLAIAETAGGDWSKEAKKAFAQLTEEDEETAGVMLLADIRNLFKKKAGDKMHSNELVAALVALEERPWAEWKRGNPMTPNSLARLLKPFGIKSEQLYIDAVNRHGYSLEAFSDAFKRYLPRPPCQNAKTLRANNYASFGKIQNARGNSDLAFEKPRKASSGTDSSVLAVERGRV